MINERFKTFRKILNMTQENIGLRLGLTQANIRDLESGKVKISTLHSLAIEHVFKVRSEWLMTGEGDMFINEGNSNNEKGVLIPSIFETHIDIVNQFEDQESAMEINQDLLCIERQSRDAFEKAKYIIRGIKEGVSIKTTEGERRKKDIPYSPDRRKQVG